MMPSLIRHRTSRQHSYPLSTDLSLFWIPAKIEKEQTSQFAAALLHEIRNPLTNINLAIETLKRMMPDDAFRVYLDIIKRSSERVNELVSNLLVSSPVNDIQLSEHCIHQLIDEVLVMAEDRLRLKNITVSKVYDKQDYKVMLNKQRMKIALTNIIINAIDAMPPENGQLKLVIRSENGQYVLEIEDNGVGISKENLSSIFKPYFSNKPGGMGLGLSTTQNILLSNNVKVDVRSEEGRGTQFMLFFIYSTKP